MEVYSSQSEENGLNALPPDAIQVYSVGVSTAGVAEIRMAQANDKRQIIATTVDERGLENTRKAVEAAGLTDRIEVKNEDVRGPLPYPDNSFDFIYARLVLHYLPKADLDAALAELFRVASAGCGLFVVVRSVDCDHTKSSDAVYDPVTRLTTYQVHPKDGSSSYPESRYFHSQESIREHLEIAGWVVQDVTDFDEQIFVDYDRKVPSIRRNNLIQVLARKLV